MSFLWPGILVLLAAVGIPVLIHILGERRYEKVYFSSIRLLKQIETDSLRRIRLRQWIILILRTLGILFLVLALAGPFSGGWRFGSPGEGVILLDTSSSSRFHKDFESAVTALLEEFPGWDTLRIHEKTSEQRFHRDREPEHVILLTDLQANAQMPLFLNTIKTRFTQAENPVVFKLNPIRESSWIKSLYIPSRYFSAGDFIPVRATLAMPENRHPLAYLTVNGKRIAQTRPGEKGDVEFSFLAESPGRYHGMVKAEGSDHPFNQRYFSLTAGEKIRILVVDDGESYLFPALEALFSVETDRVKPDAFPGTPLENRDLLILDGLYPLPEAQKARIRRFARNKPVWIIMNRLPDPSWQDLLSLSDATEITAPAGQFRLTEMPENTGPALTGFPAFPVIRYFQIPPEKHQPLIRLNDGNTFLFHLEETRFFVQTSPFRLADNRMGTHPRFTRALKTLLFYFTGTIHKDLQVGEKIPIRQAGDEIIRPDGRRVTVLEPYTKTDIPGIYSLISSDEQDYFAVNWPEPETEEATFDAPLPGFQIFPAQTDEIRSFRESLKGRSLTPFLFLLTALCWGGELLLMMLNMKKKGNHKKNV